ncbi:MAG: shikimate kinase [Nitrososphaerota archaeon]
MKSKALTYGAISIINAIPIGKGSALSINLKTIAEIEIFEDPKERILVEIDNYPNENTSLAEEVIREILKKAEIKKHGVKVKTFSNIPIGVGLKSSSAASNAIALACSSALKLNLKDLEIINIGVDASIKSGVSITGAFDDACASYFGGVVITDNYKREIVKMDKIYDNLKIVLYIPNKKFYTSQIDRKRIKSISKISYEAYEIALKNKYWEALTINGLACAAALGFDTKPIIDALELGAIASGLSGTGPAISAICEKENVNKIVSKWNNLPGKVIVCEINNNKAYVIE